MSSALNPMPVETDPLEGLLLTNLQLNMAMREFLEKRGGEEQLTDAEGEFLEQLCYVINNLTAIATSFVKAVGGDVSDMPPMPKPPSWKEVKEAHNLND